MHLLCYKTCKYIYLCLPAGWKDLCSWVDREHSCSARTRTARIGDQRTYHCSEIRNSRSINTQTNRTSLVNSPHIFILSLARSGSQSQYRIWFISPAYGVIHITSWNMCRSCRVWQKYETNTLRMLRKSGHPKGARPLGKRMSQSTTILLKTR